MEKYYLTKTAANKETKLVQINYARQPASFGLLGLTETHHLCLSILELNNNNKVKFYTSKRIELPNTAITFDASPSISIDSNEQRLHCIALCETGSLLAIYLNNGDVKELTSVSNSPAWGNFLSCKLQIDESDETQRNASCYIHLLMEKCYLIYKYETQAAGCMFELHQRYLLMSDELSSLAVRFVNLFVVDQQVALIELSNGNMRIVQGSKCLMNFWPDGQQTVKIKPTHLLINSPKQRDIILLSLIGTHLMAHSFLINSAEQSDGHAQDRTDPDGLLPAEPSFELEKCWSIDLLDIDSIRSIENDDLTDTLNGCICPIWFYNDSDWPKFIAVSFKHHILIYTFEQKTSAPFTSIVYDRSFLKMASVDSNDMSQLKQADNFETIDLKLRPKLMHNFKLIGVHQSDSIFNTLFLSFKLRLNQMRYFHPLDLLIANSTLGQLFAFKISSKLIKQNKDNVYQQLVANSIRNGSLLQEELDRLQEETKELVDEIELNESRSLYKTVGDIFQISLERNHRIGALYDLSITLSNLIQVTQIVIISTVNSHIIQPIGSSIKNFTIDNTIFNDTHKAHLLTLNVSAAEVPETIESLMRQHENDKLTIQASLVVDLEPIDKRTIITVPMFIMDGQEGHLKVYYVLAPDRERASKLSSLLKNVYTNDDFMMYHEESININPLLSYELNESIVVDPKYQLELEVKGSFTKELAFSWLNELISLKKSSLTQKVVKLYSPFTHCQIELLIGDNSLLISTDDMLAIELIKKHILKMATNRSMRLEIKQSHISLANLRHLIDLQRKNLTLIENLIKNQPNNNEKQDKNANYLDTLVSEIISETDISELTEFQLANTSIVELLSKELMNFDYQPPKEVELDDQTNHRNIQEPANILKELVTGFIIDALVDYDQIQGSRVATDKMIKMKSVLDQISNSDVTNEFVDRIMNNWSRMK